MADLRLGTDGNDVLTAGAEEAIFFGFGGDDSLTGSPEADFLYGNEGGDFLDGGTGDDLLDAGDGDDGVAAGGGDNLVLLGAGDDVFRNTAIGKDEEVLDGQDTVFGGRGADIIVWFDRVGDLVFGDEGEDWIVGSRVAADTVFGGGGFDLIESDNDDFPGEDAAGDVLSGGTGGDRIEGASAADTIEGGADDDRVSGLGGADVFVFDAAEATGYDVVTDFDRAEDTVRLVGFGGGFDPLANLSQQRDGALLDLGDGDGVLFLGRLAAEFTAGDFALV